MTTPNPAFPFICGRIPSLDGLRAIAIALVCFAHVSGTRFFPSFLIARRDLGNLGVRIFFVISGFLITTLLLEEFGKVGRISLGRFYLRRAFRILPCASTYIGIAALLSLAGWVPLTRAQLLHAATYTVNYAPDRPWHLIHLWSLAVEEQFYLLWPALLYLLRPRKSLWIAAGVLVLAPLIRIAMWFWFPTLRWSLGTSFQTNADALAAGCVLAGVWPWLSRCEEYLRFLRSNAFFLIPVAGLAACLLLARNEAPFLIFSLGCDQTILNLSIALCLDRLVRVPDGIIGLFLNGRLLVFVGVLSYSLYLWQEPFLNRLGDTLIQSFPLNLILSFLVALVSYYFIERPFLRLRKTLEQTGFLAAHPNISGRITSHINIGLNDSAAEIR
jgi:peptidoglycan/LPS O-acetylase OafA/YrhL